jgi:opacity protein-like surface antigen
LLYQPYVPQTENKKQEHQMKKILALISILTLGIVSIAAADAVPPGPVNNGAWFMQLNGDTSFPTANLANQVNQGWGGEGSIGYTFPQNFSLSAESGYDTYSTKGGINNNNNGAWVLVPLVFKLQYNVGNASTQPYLFVGGGFAFNSKSANFPGPSNETDFLEEAGVGLSFGTFFVQGKIEVDNTTGIYASDTPTIVFPINIGWKVSLD